MVAMVGAENDEARRDRIHGEIDSVFVAAMVRGIANESSTPEEMVTMAMKAGYDAAGEIMSADPSATMFALVALSTCTTKIMHAVIIAGKAQ